MNIGKLIHRQISVARVYGIPVRIDYRWFVVFGVSVWLVSMSLQRGIRGLPPVEPVVAWVLGVITTLALFLSVFGHELSHAIVGRMEGIEIEEIVLHPFGGLARLKREPDTPGAEFRIAVAGPAASFLFVLLMRTTFNPFIGRSPLGQYYGGRSYSARIPAALITAAYAAVSLLMRAASPSGVVVSISTPWLTRAARTSGC